MDLNNTITFAYLSLSLSQKHIQFLILISVKLSLVVHLYLSYQRLDVAFGYGLMDSSPTSSMISVWLVEPFLEIGDI